MTKAQQTRATKTAKSLLQKVNKNSKPITKPTAKPVHKWNRSKLAVDDYFSCHQYMQVTKVAGTIITLKNDRGDSLQIDQ